MEVKEVRWGKRGTERAGDFSLLFGGWNCVICSPDPQQILLGWLNK